VKYKVVLYIFLCSAVLAWSGGAREEVSEARVEYLAERGTIIPFHEIRIEDFISSFDYNYPDPDGEFGVTIHTGHQQVSTEGQNEILCIGLQGKRHPFQDLPPMNFVLAVDKCGSMREPDKLGWVKESLTVFLKTIRDKDFVSLVVFDDTARVLIPSIRMNGAGIRERFARQIQSIAPGGQSDIAAGLALGFKEAMSHYSPEYTNRVMLLTDGWGKATGIVKIVEEYREQGVEVSMIGYGEKFDARFAEELVDIGGGSSRFISDRQRMEEIFGSGLARTTVPLARDIRLTVSLQGARILATWGYGRHSYRGSRGAEPGNPGRQNPGCRLPPYRNCDSGLGIGGHLQQDHQRGNRGMTRS